MTDADKLEQFFARAADVLDDWQPSDDAMVSRMHDEAAFQLYCDSGYGEFWLPTKPAEPSAPAWRDGPLEALRYHLTHPAHMLRQLLAGHSS